MALLELHDLCVSYGEVHAVREMNLEVHEGQIVGLLGANGAGKSSVANAVTGLVKPRSGRVRFLGEDVTGRGAFQLARRGLVQVPEGRRLTPGLSVEDNLMLGGYPVSPRTKAARANLDEIYELFPELVKRRKTAAGSLSGGEQQMVAVGRGLMSRPKLLVLDEPSMGLSPVLVERLMATLATIAGRGISVLLSEQNVVAALPHVSYIYLLQLGRVVDHRDAATVEGTGSLIDAYLS